MRSTSFPTSFPGSFFYFEVEKGPWERDCVIPSFNANLILGWVLRPLRLVFLSTMTLYRQISKSLQGSQNGLPAFFKFSGTSVSSGRTCWGQSRTSGNWWAPLSMTCNLYYGSCIWCLSKVCHTKSVKMIWCSKRISTFPAAKEAAKSLSPWKFSRYVIAAMLVDENKRFLISSFCFSTSNCTLQHCYLCPLRLVANHL